MSLALAATTAVALFFGLGAPKLPPKLPTSPIPIPSTSVQVTMEPDCSATKSFQLPPTRVFGMAPTTGFDWTLAELRSEALQADVVPLPRGIDLVLRLSADSDNAHYAREQHLRLPITPPVGCEVSHTSAERDQILLRGKDQLERVYGNAFVDEATCAADTSNPEKMKQTGCRRVEFDPITIHFRKKSPTTCGVVDIVPPPVDGMTMKRTLAGNDAFSSSEAYVEIDVENENTTSRVKLRTRVTIQEAGDDRSRFTSDWITSTAFDTALQAPGCKVKSVENATGRLRDRAKYTRNAGYRPSPLDGSSPGSDRRGVLKFAGCRSATMNVANLGCMVNFNAIRIHLEPA